MFDLLLIGGTIVSPRGSFCGDIGVISGKINSIGKDLSKEGASTTLSMKGFHILPGCINSHMHLWEAGFVAGNDFSSGTLTALSGGITTIIDQPLTPPEVLNGEVFRSKRSLGESTSYVDFALHAGVGHDNLDSLVDMWNEGCIAFKVFMSDSGCKVAALPDGELRAVFCEVGRLGGTVLIHAENEAMLNHNLASLKTSRAKRSPGVSGLATTRSGARGDPSRLMAAQRDGSQGGFSTYHPAGGCRSNSTSSNGWPGCICGNLSP